METKVVVIDEKKEKKEEIVEKLKGPARALRDGKLVVFPTETVYGLGANALDIKAVEKIFIAKGRPQDNPLIIHIYHKSQLEEMVLEIPPYAKKLMDRFWPGPITFILKKKDIVPNITSAGLDSIGIRMPKDQVARMLLKESGIPIAAPSANISGRPSPTNLERCIFDLNGRVDYIIGGEASSLGLESTVVDCTTFPMCILRPGAITISMLKEVDENIYIDKALNQNKEDEKVKAKAPGMKYRHYAPLAKIVLVKGEINKVSKKINELIKENKEIGKVVGVLCSEETKGLYKNVVTISVGSRKNPEDIAKNLFEVLRSFDDNKVDIIISETFDENGVGIAIMNRLNKAASFNTIEI